jgi:hypothetical protein
MDTFLMQFRFIAALPFIFPIAVHVFRLSDRLIVRSLLSLHPLSEVASLNERLAPCGVCNDEGVAGSWMCGPSAAHLRVE